MTKTFENMDYLDIHFLRVNDFLCNTTLGVQIEIKSSRFGKAYSKGNFRLITKPFNHTPHIRLLYTYSPSFGSKEDMDYYIELDFVPSNLGKGNIIYFKCPATGKRAKKLYMYGGYFVHRDACEGVYYYDQTLSKKDREFDRFCNSIRPDYMNY